MTLIISKIKSMNSDKKTNYKVYKIINGNDLKKKYNVPLKYDYMHKYLN